MKVNRLGIYISLVLSLYGCRCPKYFKVDNGKNWKENGKLYRFSDIKEQDFVLSVHRYDSEISFNILTKFNAPSYVKERGVKVTFRQLTPVLDTKVELIRHERECLIAYTDSTLKHRVKDEYYTCQNFRQELKKSKKLYLKVVYNLDSSGTTKTMEKTYTLFKKRHCYFSVH